MDSVILRACSLRHVKNHNIINFNVVSYQVQFRCAAHAVQSQEDWWGVAGGLQACRLHHGGGFPRD